MAVRRSFLRAFAGRFALAALIAALFMGGAVASVNYVIDVKLGAVTRVKVTLADAHPKGANYLLIGSDTRAFVSTEGERDAFGDQTDAGGQRSDTMMVLHVEPDAQRTLAVSFPRDLWVDIPGVGKSKINAAFNDGPDKTIETLKANFGIEINHYLEVDFKSFRGIVNAIGSVPVYFPYPARDEMTALYIPQPGCVRLDGNGALSYVRSRYLEYFSTERSKWVSVDAVPDINRIARQQDFIRRLAGLAVQKGLNDPLTANEIANRVLENMKIDQSFTKESIFGLIDAFRTINTEDQTALELVTLPWANGPLQNGQSVLFAKQPEADALVARLQDFSGNKSSGTQTAAPGSVKLRVLNGSGHAGIAAGAIGELSRLGFVKSGTGNDERSTVPLTEVRYRPGALAKGRTVLEFVRPSARLVEDSSIKGADVVLVLGTDFDSIVAAAVSSTSSTAPGAPGTPAPEATGSTPPPIGNQSQLGEPAPKTPPC